MKMPCVAPRVIHTLPVMRSWLAARVKSAKAALENVMSLGPADQMIEAWAVSGREGAESGNRRKKARHW